MEDEVDFFCEDFDGVDFAALSEHFGPPEEVANDLLVEVGADTMYRSNLLRRCVRYFFAAIFTIAAVFIILVGIHTYYIQHKLLDSHYVESIVYDENITPYATAPVYSVETFSD